MGKIHIVTTAKFEMVEVRISDTGDGIADSIKEKIFEPFFTTKEIGKGTGQGLAIAWAAVVKHGGRLFCESQLGQGSCFVIQLPIEPKDNSHRDRLQAA